MSKLLRSGKEIRILPFENADVSQLRESLSAAAILCGFEPFFEPDIYVTCDQSDAEKKRKQRDAIRTISLTKDQLSESNKDKYSLLITNQDIFARDQKFVFGISNGEMRTALLSIYRVTRWEEDLTPSLVQERIMKEAAHEIGHLGGLAHCRDAKCPMSYSRNLEELDGKLPMFCERCFSRLRRVAMA